MAGWIKLHRALMEKVIWQNSSSEQKAILITLLMLANHQTKEWEWQGKKFVAKPGQFITSLDSIAKKAGKDISIQNVRSALKKFKKYDFLTDESTKTGRLISITNWNVYQEEDELVTKVLTKSQQSTNKALTPNKNDKNDKNKDIKNNVAAEARHDESSVYFKCANYMRSKILEINPNAKLPEEDPDSLDKWSDDIRKILVLDKRELDELRALVNYVYEVSDFWNSVIQSPAGLRKHWDKISNQMTSVKPKTGKKAQNIQGGNYSTLSNNDLENMLTKKRESLRNEVG